MADINYPIANNDELIEHKLDYVEEVGTVADLTTTSKVAVGAINELNVNKANKTQEAWLTPTLLNGVTNFASREVGYRKNGFGNIEIMGVIVPPNSGTTVFNLPIGYRPTLLTYYTGTTAGDNRAVGVEISAAGVVKVFGTFTTYVNLAGAIFI